MVRSAENQNTLQRSLSNLFSGTDMFSSAGGIKARTQLKSKNYELALRPIFLQLTDLSEVDMESLHQAASKEAARQILSRCLKVDQSGGFRREIVADMHYHNYSFCRKCGMSAVKTSCFLSIMKALLEESVAQRLPVEAASALFLKWLLKHAVERPPKSVGVFSYEDVTRIKDHVHNTFFRHYRLYMYVYPPHCQMAFRAEDRNVGAVVPYPEPLKMQVISEIEAKDQPEFAHLFVPSEREQAEATLRNIRDRDKPEDTALVIKRKVDEGVQKLMTTFEEKLKEQDARFQAMLEGR